MANQTVYPYGTGGELPSNIGIINDLTTGGVDKALSAEMGKQLETEISQLGLTEGSFPSSVKMLLISTLEKVAWVDEHGQDYIDELREALLGGVYVTSISAVFSLGDAVITTTSSLDDLRSYLTVTATYSDQSTAIVRSYELSGSMEAGSDTITVTYMNRTTSFIVTVLNNYASNLLDWITSTSGTITKTNEEIAMKCNSSSQITNYDVWCADVKKTLWSTVNGKTIKVRIKTNDVSYTYGQFGLGIFASASSTSLSNNYTKRAGLAPDSFTLSDDGYYETTFVCDINAFNYGSLTPTSSSTFGVWCYARSMSGYLTINDVQIIEIQS